MVPIAHEAIVRWAQGFRPPYVESANPLRKRWREAQLKLESIDSLILIRNKNSAIHSHPESRAMTTGRSSSEVFFFSYEDGKA